ncbi:STE24 endopeptidase [[Emmonsia] crescens]|uniref:STE24 endopeptidase n=1 Tax=[Emmonsia] crescens TaxID=73230 RepID=A0A2B7ZAZ2_9EURO|nr:STE24 endopeptidase [Emmonsia crescens]
MPTPLDKALNSKNLFLGFAGLVTAAAVWSIWGGDMFPAESDPTGNPDNWTIEELRRWLSLRGLLPSSTASREDLIERVKANLRHPPS